MHSSKSANENRADRVPCFVLFHVGLSITKWGLWDGRPKGCLEFVKGRRRSREDGPTREALDPGEWLLVFLMVAFSLPQYSTNDSANAVLPPLIQFAVGMLFAFGNTVVLQRSQKIFRKSGDIAHLRSDVLRSDKDSSILADRGSKVLIKQFEEGVMSFHNA